MARKQSVGRSDRRKLSLPFTSDRLRLLEPLISAEVRELAYERLLGRKFFHSGGYILPNEKSVAKLALLLVLEMNPFEILSGDEEGLMRGIDADTLRARKKDKLVRLI